MPENKDGRTTFTANEVRNGALKIEIDGKTRFLSIEPEITHQERPLEAYRPEGPTQPPAAPDAEQTIAEFESHAATHSKDDDGMSL